MDEKPPYEKTHRSTVNRLKQRGTYDQETIHNIIDSVPVLNVSFTPTSLDDDPFPTILPMLGCTGSYTPPSSTESSPPAIYLHGWVTSRFFKSPQSKLVQEHEDEWPGHPVCVAATHMDGLVLALTPFNSSCNYRSAVVHGWANIVTDPKEREYALELITNNILTDQWRHSRVPPSEAELKSTGVLRVNIVSASAKIRAATVGNDRSDLTNEQVVGKVWTGVVPSWITYGEPIPGAENQVAAAPSYIRDWIQKQNKEGEEYARRVAVQAKK